MGTASLAGSGGNEDEVPLGDAVAEVKIWQLHNKYLICQIKTGLMIIDQHVAHERVLYERAVDVMETSVPNSQQLLFPQKVELRPWDWEIFEEIRDDLYRLGFNLSLFGSRTVMIEGVPQDVRPGSEVSILQDMIAEYSENASKLKLEKRDNLAKSYSCRNAIMTGQKLSLQEMRSLIDSLFATRDPYCCPHGRPVIIKMTLGQLDTCLAASSSGAFLFLYGKGAKFTPDGYTLVAQWIEQQFPKLWVAVRVCPRVPASKSPECSPGFLHSTHAWRSTGYWQSAFPCCFFPLPPP